MSFVLWRRAYAEGFCVVTVPQGIDDLYEIDDGISISERFPADAYCAMDPEYLKDIQLADNLYGTGYTIISKRLQEILDKEGVKAVEYLPIRILNHKGRTASKDYFLMNPLTICDCIDVDKSGVRWNAISKNTIANCKKLVLRENDIPPDNTIFRPKLWTMLILLQNTLAEKLTSAGFTGLSFRKPETFRGIG